MAKRWNKTTISWVSNAATKTPISPDEEETIAIASAVGTLQPNRHAVLELSFGGKKASQAAITAGKLLAENKDKLGERVYRSADDGCKDVSHPQTESGQIRITVLLETGDRFAEIMMGVFRNILTVLGVEREKIPYVLTRFAINYSVFVELEGHWITHESALQMSFRLPGLYII